MDDFPSMPRDIVDRGWHQLWEQAQEWQRRGDTQDAWPIARGSHLAGDDRKSAPAQVSHAAKASLLAATDHQHAVCALIAEAHMLHTFAGATLVRGAIEAASAAIWVLQPGDRLERVCRSARWASQDVRDRLRAEESLGQKGDAKAAVTEIVGPVAASTGIAVSDLSRPVTSTAIVRAAELEVERRQPGLGPLVIWQLASGFAHARRWPALAFAEREERDTLDPGTVNVRFSMSPDRLLMLAAVSANTIEVAVELFDLRAGPVTPPARRMN